MLPPRAINYLIKLPVSAIKKTTFGLLARVMQALTLGYIQEIEDKFPLLITEDNPQKTRFYGTRFFVQTSKGGKQSITLPSYEAYKHSNNQNNTITFTRKPWYT